jgi:uncharacterized ubiquitin-like protein YukD
MYVDVTLDDFGKDEIMDYVKDYLTIKDIIEILKHKGYPAEVTDMVEIYSEEKRLTNTDLERWKNWAGVKR